MMKTTMIAAFVLGALTGCASHFDRAAMDVELGKELRVFTDDEDVLKIDQLRPQIRFPIRLAVVPPSRELPGCGTHGRFAVEGENDLLRAVGDKLKREGIVSDFMIVPEMLLHTGMPPGPASYLRSVRIAAARLQADAVLILRSVTDTDSTVNVLGVLDLTLAGLFIVPAHQKDALTVVEGLVIDNRNQYLYFAASAEGKGSTLGPLALLDETKAIQESRRAALQAFGESLVHEAILAKTAGPGPRYPTDDPK